MTPFGSSSLIWGHQTRRLLKSPSSSFLISGSYPGLFVTKIFRSWCYRPTRSSPVRVPGRGLSPRVADGRAIASILRQERDRDLEWKGGDMFAS